MNNQLQIAIDARALGEQRTGDEIYTRELIRNLLIQHPEHSYHLLFGKYPKKFPFLRTSNVHIHEILPERKGLWTFWTMPKYLQKIQPDILHIQYTTPQWFSPLPKKTKIITTIHDVAYKYHPEWISRKDRMLWNIFLKPSMKQADAIIAVSKNTKKDIQKFFSIPEKKIHVIYNGIELKYRRISNQHKLDYVKNKYHLPQSFILYLGTLQPRKNIPVLLQGFELFKQQNRNNSIKLVIAGKRNGYNYDTEIDRTLNSMTFKNNVLFPGYIAEDDKTALYNLASIFVWPSLYEGFGHPPLEAMACGTHVIANKTLCNSEILQEQALLINLNPELLAASILSTIKSKTETNYLSQYNWQNCAKETQSLYLQLLA